MRKKLTIRNAITALISNFTVLLFGFILQKVFIVTLGDELLGLNSLLGNVVSMLAIADLGIGSAIVYSLYEPLAKKETEKVKSLMHFYKKVYSLIGIAILLIGIILLPFLKIIVNTTLDINIYLIFILFLMDTVFSYFLSYKRSILQADQRSYYINIVHIFYSLVLNISLIIILYCTKNYILFLIMKIICRILENVIILLIANKKYPYINETYQKLDKETNNSIFKRVKGLVFHKVGSFIVLGTDNIIISKFLGNVIVAYYSNYYMITNAVSLLLSQMFSAVTASVGNLLTEDNSEKSYSLFRKLMFVNFWIYSLATTAIFLMMEPFISLWVGSERLLPFSVLIIITINFYMMGMRASIGVYKDAAGIYYEDRYVPLIESALNIIVSLIFVKIWGLFGVFFGTFISSLIVVFYSLPYFVYKKVFKKSIFQYYKLYVKYIILTTFTTGISYFILKNIVNMLFLSNNIIILLVAAFITLIIPNVIYFILFRKSEELQYFLDFVKNGLKKIIRKSRGEK